MALHKALWRLSFRASVEDEEAISEQILAWTGTYPAVRQRPRAKRVRFEVFFPSRAKLARVQRKLNHFKPRASVLPYENWAESWKKHFPVQRVGRRIRIKPSWRAYRAHAHEVVIELDPGMSFGTGQHETTRFCLRMIERLGCPRSLLDVGTGSGILSIAAAKLGCEPILALDNDPQAVRVTKQNAQNNRVHFSVRRIAFAEWSASRTFDLVVANLLADLILDQRRKLVSLVAPGGHLVLAGILAKESAAVRRAFRGLGLKPFACERRGHWTGFVFCKPAKKIREKAASNR